MPPERDDPIPLEALRDLLGIVRALYAAWAREKASPIALEELHQVGRELAQALALAQRSPPGTLGHAAAWNRSERATEALGKLVQGSMPLKPALDTAVDRVFAARPEHPGLPERPSRDEARRLRRLRS